jgi:hypothetical protein
MAISPVDYLLPHRAGNGREPFFSAHLLTSECERSFSSAKLTLNPLRTCMKSGLIEAIETLRAWYLRDQQEKDRAKKETRLKEEQKVISEAIAGGGGEVIENCR